MITLSSDNNSKLDCVKLKQMLSDRYNNNMNPAVKYKLGEMRLPASSEIDLELGI